MWFQFELPEPVTLAEIQFQSNPGGPTPPAGSPPRPIPYPRGYRVQVSMDGSAWSDAVAEGQGTGQLVVIAFEPVRARFVRITQTATTESAPPWSMQQIQLYEVRRARR